MDCYYNIFYINVPVLSPPDNVARISDFIFTPRNNVCISQTYIFLNSYNPKLGCMYIIKIG